MNISCIAPAHRSSDRAADCLLAEPTDRHTDLKSLRGRFLRDCLMSAS